VSLEQKIRKLRQDIDNYDQTVDALVLFGHVLIWDDKLKAVRPSSKFSLGRRFDCSPKNRVNPSGEATPDLSALFSATYGILAEAKISLKDSLEFHEDDLRQLMKYDDILTGWPTKTGKVSCADVVVLPHYTRKGAVKSLLEKAAEQGKFSMQCKFAAISFVRLTQAGGEYMAFDLFHGSLSDQNLQDRFGPLTVPMERVRPLYPFKVYDSEPPLPLTLTILWDQVMSALVDVKSYKSLKGTELECTVEQLVDSFSKAFAPPQPDSRDPKLPKKAWIKKALNFLVSAKLAKCADVEAEKYLIQYRRKSSTLEFFIKLYARKSGSKKRRSGAGNPSPRRGRRRTKPSGPSLFPDD
jgi:hypothetical protein